MNLRQLCNATYAAFVEFKTTKEREAFDRMLSTPPPRAAGVAAPQGRSSGTGDLMAAFGAPRR